VAITSQEEKRNCCVEGPLIAESIAMSLNIYLAVGHHIPEDGALRSKIPHNYFFHFSSSEFVEQSIIYPTKKN
jgi:hypothetical protein